MFVISSGIIEMGNAHECILAYKDLATIDDDEPLSLSPEEDFDE